ncbi:MAG: hypothetical protein E8D50_07685 [Nitrospira sp.]|nr:MAG: hypothetical protein E8D50_07685 [Nitrospira sp.]
MRTVLFFLLVLCLAPFFRDGIAEGMSQKERTAIRKELTRLRTANPAMDLETAMTHGDYRFVGLMGYSLMVPGVDQDLFRKNYEPKFGFKVIEGTSDYFEIPEQEELVRIGTTYAERYNRLLEKEIANKPIKPPSTK